MPIDVKKCQTSKAGNIITPKGRLSYPYLDKPRAPMNNTEGKKKYSCSILIPPGCDLTLLKQAAEKAATDKWGANGIPKNLKSPFLDPTTQKHLEEFEGWTLLRCSTERKVGVVNSKGESVDPDDTNEIYGGRWGLLSVRSYAYDVSGNRGVSFGLQAVQLADHDKAFGGHSRAEEEFAPIEVDDEDGSGEAQSVSNVNQLF